MLWLNVRNVRTSTSVSGELITMQSCPLGDAWPAWSSISVSASSCFIHNSSTLLQSIPFSPSVSLWHSIPSVTQSEPKSANLTKYYSGFCHSCIRKYARFSLCCFLQSGISSTGWDTSDCRAGQLFECYRLHHSVLSLGSWWIHQDTDPWSGQSWSCPGTPTVSRDGRHSSLDYWMSLVYLSWNAIAKPSSIHTADPGTSSTCWAFPSRMWSSAAFAVFVGVPSAVAIYHGSDPSGHVNTYCMFIYRCCAMTTMPSKQTNLGQPWWRQQLHTVGLIVLDFARFTNGCKLDFGNGANKSISFDFSLFSAKLTKAALPLFSAVSTSSLMLSVLSLPMQC